MEAAGRRAITSFVIVCLAVLPGACTTGDPLAGPVGTSELTSVDPTPITVTVSLPRAGHSEAVDGSVTNGNGEVVASFRLVPDFVFLEDGSAENDYRPSTSSVVGGTSATVELPGAGTYTFTIDGVFFWGGCGTCGAIFDGGSVERDVLDGSAVKLDLGIQSGST